MIADRLRAQHLTGPGLPGPVEVVGQFGAMQAQDFPGVLWAIAQRLAPDHAATVGDLLACFNAGMLVRTHLLRPTWHLVSPADLRWLLALSGPRVQQANGHGYTRLGITPRHRLAAERTLRRTLEGGRALTRRELADALQSAGISPEGQRLVYLVMHAELEGLVCSGPMRGAHHTYMLVDERVSASGPDLTREAALARLVGLYFATRGPATLRDCAWWSGLTLRDVREGIALAGTALARRTDEGVEYWAATDAPARPRAGRPRLHLLPNFDEFTVAYRDRTALLAPGVPATSSSQMGLLSQPVMVHGRHAGTWTRVIRARHVEVGVTPSAGCAIDSRDLRDAARRYATFIGREVRTLVRQRRSSTTIVTT